MRIGDKVKLIDTGCGCDICLERVGEILTVINIDDSAYPYICQDNDGDEDSYDLTDIELIQTSINPNFINYVKQESLI
jgi:hypothetical protein